MLRASTHLWYVPLLLEKLKGFEIEVVFHVFCISIVGYPRTPILGLGWILTFSDVAKVTSLSCTTKLIFNFYSSKLRFLQHTVHNNTGPILENCLFLLTIFYIKAKPNEWLMTIFQNSQYLQLWKLNLIWIENYIQKPGCYERVTLKKHAMFLSK